MIPIWIKYPEQKPSRLIWPERLPNNPMTGEKNYVDIYDDEYFYSLMDKSYSELTEYMKENIPAKDYEKYYDILIRTKPHEMYCDLGFTPAEWSPLWVKVNNEKILSWYIKGKFYKHGENAKSDPIENITEWMYADDMHRKIKRGEV